MAITSPMEPLVGRAADLAALDALLASDHRLVTITGPAGAGKTRLAIEIGARFAASAGAPAVHTAALAEARNASGICDAVALALGIQGDPGSEDRVALVGRALAGRGEVMLILDELDALVEHAAATVGRWMAMAPEALFVATSRERLRLPGEAVHELGPLGLPQAEGGGGAESEAVELFVRAARRARATFTPSPAEAPYLAAIVRELDGLPLAIELAAPRMAVMGARALLHRLGSRFDVLRRSGAGRHATLEAAIDSSFQGLTAWEHDALAQCSVFRGGFTIEAAEAVIDVRAHAGAPAALDIVEKLRDRSLIHAHEPPRIPGEVRLGIYASVREHARRRLDPEAERAAEARHAEAVVRAAEAWARESIGRRASEARARILLERDNLLAVLERILTRKPVSARAAEPALRALIVLAPVLADEGPLDAYVELLDPVLSATADSGADPRLYANALAVRGALARRRGKGRAGGRDLVRALSAATTLGDRRLEARVTLELAHVLAARGEAAHAEQHFERARELHRELGDRAGMGDALHGLAALLARRGRLDEAVALVERALAVHRAEQCSAAEVADLRLHAELLLDAGRVNEARASLGTARALAPEAGARRDDALAIALLGLADDLAGDLAAARAAYERAAGALRELGFVALEAVVTGRTGVLAMREGRTAEAYALLGAAEGALTEEAERARGGVFLAYKAALDAHVGRVSEARAAIEEAARRCAGDDFPAATAVLDLARAVIDPHASAAAGEAARAVAPRSAEVRLSLACFARVAGPTVKEPPPPPDDALVIGPAGRWFRLPHSERVPLDHRRPLALILSRLAGERLDRPGTPLPWEALLEAGWPGERVLPAAGAHRVRVALSTLRKLGLKDVLCTTGEGYVISPDVPLSRVA